MPKVKVLGNWRVVTDDGTGYTAGEVVDVDENTAAEWISSGWVSEVTTPTKAAAPRKRASR